MEANHPNQIASGETEPLIIEQNGLLQVTEGETMTQGVPEAVLMPSFSKNRSIFPTSDPSPDLVERSYLIADFDLTEGAFQTVLPWSALLSATRMPQQIVRKYDRFRADISLKIQIVSAATTYGVLNGWVVPMEASSRAGYITAPISDIRQFKTWSGNSGFTLSIADQEGIEFNYPWATPEHSFDTSDPDTPSKLISLASLHFSAPVVKNITPGVTSPTISVQVYARFTNVMLAGPRFTLSPSLGTPFLSGMTSKKFVSAWRLHGDSCSFTQNDDDAVPENSVAKKLVDYSAVEKRSPYKVRHAVGQMEVVAAAVSGVAIATEATMAISSLVQGAQQVKDDGIKLLETHKSEASQLHPDMLEPGQSNQRQGYKISTYGDLSSFLTSNSFANLNDHSNIISPNSDFVTDTAVAHNFYEMSTRWFVQRAFLNWGSAGEREYTEPVHPAPGQIVLVGGTQSTENYGYLQFASRFYRMWRGNIDYRLQFFGSDLITMRVLVTIHFSARSLGDTQPTAADLIEQTGDVLSETFTVRGSTTIEFSVPFLRGSAFAEINDFSNIAYVTVAVISVVPEEVDGTDVSLPMYVSTRAGSNFQFCNFTGGIINGDPVPVVEAEGQGMINGESSNSDICTIFDGTSPPPTVLDFRGSTGNFYHLLKRPSIVDELTNVNTLPGQYIFAQSGDGLAWNVSYNNSRTLDKLAYLFLWWTGSMRHKMYFREFGSTSLLSATLENRNFATGFTNDYFYKSEYGQHATEASVWPFLEFEVPYVNQYVASQTFLTVTQSEPWVTNPHQIYLHDAQDPAVPSPEVHYTSIGDDFQFYFALPPPSILFPMRRNGMHSFVAPTNIREAEGQSALVSTLTIHPVVYSGINTNIVEPFISASLSQMLPSYTADRVAHTVTLSPAGPGTDFLTIEFRATSDNSLLGLETVSAPAGAQKRFIVNSFYGPGPISAIGSISVTISHPGPENLIYLVDVVSCFSDTITFGNSGNTVLAGYTADYPLWISEVKPPSGAPVGDDIVITDTDLQNPVWVSRVQPPAIPPINLAESSIMKMPPHLEEVVSHIDQLIDSPSLTHTIVNEETGEVKSRSYFNPWG